MYGVLPAYMTHTACWLFLNALVGSADGQGMAGSAFQIPRQGQLNWHTITLRPLDKDWGGMAEGTELKESWKEGRAGRASQRDPPSAASGGGRRGLPGEPLLCQDDGHNRPLQV